MSREARLVAMLLGAGVATFALAFWVRHEQGAGMVERPAASGEVGVLLVFAQLEGRGPVRLMPGQSTTLPRPQELGFQWNVKGTGPRLIRIELLFAGDRVVLHEERLAAPADQQPISYLLHLGDTAPAEVTLVVTVEAPHTRALVLEYPIVLTSAG